MEEVTIYCPSCRGRFEVDANDVVEEEVFDCTLCASEVLILQVDPLKIKLFSEQDDF